MFLNCLKLFIAMGLLAVQGKQMTSEVLPYYKMPPLYTLDNYDYCMTDETVNTRIYCLINAQIIPDPNKPLWQEINAYSSNVKNYFRHDKLVFGKCLDWCTHSTDINMYNVEIQNKTENTETPVFLFDDNNKINTIMHKCLNETFNKKYGLSLITEVEYCDTSADNMETDILDIGFVVLLFILLALCIISSSFDFFLKRKLTLKSQNNQHYKKNELGNVNSYLVTFSITRNWYRLTMASTKKYGEDLRCLDCIKTALMLIIVMAHLIMMFFTVPVVNPEYLESFFGKFPSIIMFNAWIIINTFFAISGFLLSIGMLSYFNEAKPPTFYQIVQIIFLRYIRFFTVYAVVLFFEATIAPKLSEGPLWKHFNYEERNACRKNWWINLLFLNNYLGMDKVCMIQCWYLAPEFHLFIINLFILALILKYPSRKRIIIATGIAVSLLLPGLTVYFQKLDGVLILTPENIRDFFLKDKGFRDFYIPTHLNFGSSFIGLIAGFLFIQYKSENKSFTDKPGIVFFAYFINVLAIIFMLCGYPFYYWDFPKPSIWAAVYSTLFRNFWGLYSVIVILAFSFGIGWIAREFVCHPISRVFGRLTFGAFVCHFTILRFFFATLRQPFYMSYAVVVVYTIAIWFFTYMVSFILALVVELPTSALMKQMKS